MRIVLVIVLVLQDLQNLLCVLLQIFQLRHRLIDYNSSYLLI